MSEITNKINSIIDQIQVKGIAPNEAQFKNIVERIEEIKTEYEISQLNDKEIIQLVRQVWPVAQYVDRN